MVEQSSRDPSALVFVIFERLILKKSMFLKLSKADVEDV